MFFFFFFPVTDAAAAVVSVDACFPKINGTDVSQKRESQ